MYCRGDAPVHTSSEQSACALHRRRVSRRAQQENLPVILLFGGVRHFYFIICLQNCIFFR